MNFTETSKEERKAKYQQLRKLGVDANRARNIRQWRQCRIDLWLRALAKDPKPHEETNGT